MGSTHIPHGRSRLRGTETVRLALPWPEESMPQVWHCTPTCLRGDLPTPPPTLFLPLDSYRVPDFLKLPSFHLSPSRSRRVHLIWSLPCHWGSEAGPGQPHCHQHSGFPQGKDTG